MKRIWYIPGAISLVLLLPLTQWKLEQDREARIETCLSIELLGDDQDLHGLPTRNWTTMELTDRPNEQREQIMQFKERIHKLNADLDTTEGVVLTIPRNLRYQSFIDAIEFADNDSIGEMLLSASEIRWFVKPAEALPEQEVADYLYGDYLYPDWCGYEYPHSYPLLSRLFIADQTSSVQSLGRMWPICALWLALATLSIGRLRRQTIPN